jgi:broad specificity phosphatase PhoE
MDPQSPTGSVFDPTRTSPFKGKYAGLLELQAESPVEGFASDLPPIPQLFFSQRARVRVYLCRHGETELNATGRLQGSGQDVDLNEQGRHQAALMAAKLHKTVPRVDFLVSSQLRRAVQTADAVSLYYPKAHRQIIPEFMEISWGECEGFVSPDLTWLTERWQRGDWEAKTRGGESPADCLRRFVPAFYRLIEQALVSSPGTNNDDELKHVVVVSHGRLLRIVMAYLIERDLTHMSLYQHHNTTINVLDAVENHSHHGSAVGLLGASRPHLDTIYGWIPAVLDDHSHLSHHYTK